MQKTQLNVRLDDNVIKALNATGDRYSMTANTILAAAACELARVRPEQIWHALGRIADGERVEIVGADRETLPEARRSPKRALLANA
jgi:hypothetical protein